MKTAYVIVGLVAVGAGAWYLYGASSVAKKAADAPTPPKTSIVGGGSNLVDGIVGLATSAGSFIQGLWGASASSTTAKVTPPATNTNPPAVRVSSRLVSSTYAHSPELS